MFSALHGISSPIRRQIVRVMEAFKADDSSLCAHELSCLVGSGFGNDEFIGRLAKAMKSSRWEDMASMFDSTEFVGAHGTFLLAGPYARSRNRTRETVNSAVAGVVMFDESQIELREVSKRIFDCYPHPTNRLLGVMELSCVGAVGGRNGEAFLVPNAWAFGGSTTGPALNLLVEQYHRIHDGFRYLQDVFDSSSLEWLRGLALDPLDSLIRRNLEFHFHEHGHATGLGFRTKLEGGFFRQLVHCGIEEWRSDGVSFRLAEESGDRDVANGVAAACIILRLGVDARRNGNVMRDHDAYAAALMLSDMLRSGTVTIDQRGALRIVDPREDGGSALVARQAAIAVELTIQEKESRAEGLADLYRNTRPLDDAIGVIERIGRLP